MFERLYDTLANNLGVFSNSIYVNASGKDQINCGLINGPCRSLSFSMNNISSHSDKIYLFASQVKQVFYVLENPVVIKHSLTVTKTSTNSQNPVIRHHFNVPSNWKEV